jgi:hypothetical protein
VAFAFSCQRSDEAHIRRICTFIPDAGSFAINIWSTSTVLHAAAACPELVEWSNAACDDVDGNKKWQKLVDELKSN